MPNTNAPSGFKPVRYLSGQPYSGSVNIYSVPAADASAIGVGDPVKLNGTAQVIGDTTYPDVILAATGNIMVGVCVAVLADTRDSLVYRAASTQRLVVVADDPNLVFEVQDISTGTPLAAADIGLNVNFVAGAVNTTTGRSTLTLDNTTDATTATLDCKIVGFVNRPDNEAGASGRWLVRLNRHSHVNQVAGV